MLWTNYIGSARYGDRSPIIGIKIFLILERYLFYLYFIKKIFLFNYFIITEKIRPYYENKRCLVRPKAYWLSS